jgi:hypothetical protein
MIEENIISVLNKSGCVNFLVQYNKIEKLQNKIKYKINLNTK